MSNRLLEAKQNRHEAKGKIDAILDTAAGESRQMTDRELKDLVSLRADVKELDQSIARVESVNSLSRQFDRGGPICFSGGDPGSKTTNGKPGEAPAATAFRQEFGGWMTGSLNSLGGGQMATSPLGPVSIGGVSGTESVAG